MKIKTQTSRLLDPEVILLGENVGNNATGKPEFATGPILPADVLALVTTAKDSYIAEAEAAAFLAGERAKRIDAMAKLRVGIDDFARHAHTAYDGDVDKLVALGFAKRKKGTPIGQLPKPLNLRSDPGALSGTIAVLWDRLGVGRPYYFLECATNINGPWTLSYHGTAARAVCTGLTAGAEYYFRVRAHGFAGFSPWSDVSSTHAQW